MVPFRLLLLAIFIKTRDIPMFPKVEFDFSKRENIFCETVLDQGVVEGVGEGLDPEFEGPEFGRGFEAFHFFGHKRLVYVVSFGIARFQVGTDALEELEEDIVQLGNDLRFQGRMELSTRPRIVSA